MTYLFETANVVHSELSSYALKRVLGMFSYLTHIAGRVPTYLYDVHLQIDYRKHYIYTFGSLVYDRSF